MAETWTDDRAEQLRSLWDKGLSCMTIADRMFGDPKKRNSIICKAHRLGLSARGKPTNAPLATHHDIAKFVRKMKLAPTRSKPQPPRAADVEPLSKPITIIELTLTTCRWPVSEMPSDTPFYYCGAVAPVDKPYCSVHAARAFQAPAQRRIAHG